MRASVAITGNYVDYIWIYLKYLSWEEILNLCVACKLYISEYSSEFNKVLCKSTHIKVFSRTVIYSFLTVSYLHIWRKSRINFAVCYYFTNGEIKVILKSVNLTKESKLINCSWYESCKCLQVKFSIPWFKGIQSLDILPTIRNIPVEIAYLNQHLKFQTDF